MGEDHPDAYFFAKDGRVARQVEGNGVAVIVPDIDSVLEIAVGFSVGLQSKAKEKENEKERFHL